MQFTLTFSLPWWTAICVVIAITPPFDTGGFIRVHEDEITVTVYFQRRDRRLPEIPARSR